MISDLFQKPRYEETEAAIDDFRFLVLSLKQIREPTRDLFPVIYQGAGVSVQVLSELVMARFRPP